MEYRVFVLEYRALLVEYRALLMDFRALLMEYRALLAHQWRKGGNTFLFWCTHRQTGRGHAAIFIGLFW